MATDNERKFLGWDGTEQLVATVKDLLDDKPTRNEITSAATTAANQAIDNLLTNDEVTFTGTVKGDYISIGNSDTSIGLEYNKKIDKPTLAFVESVNEWPVTLQGIAAPTDDYQAANKKYVDDSINNLLTNEDGVQFSGPITASEVKPSWITLGGNTDDTRGAEIDYKRTNNGADYEYSVISIQDVSEGPNVVLRGIDAPIFEADAANKLYVDTAVNDVKNDLLNGAGAAYDTLKELGDLITDNQDAIDALETVATGKADKDHDHDISDVNGLQSALDDKAPKGNYVTYTKSNDVSVAGTTKPVFRIAPPETNNNTSDSSAGAYFPEGIIMGGSAKSAGLTTRGICGISSPDAKTGACSKDNLYVNYDGDNTYKANRHLILQAGTAGSNYGNNVYQFAAVRGDALKGYVNANSAGKKITDGGEVFNDYTNNKAHSANSHAEGWTSKAGGKGFKITAVSDNENGTGTYTLSSVTGIEVGMEYSVRLTEARYKAGKITAINGNVVTVDGYKHLEIETDADGTYSIENYLTIVGKPDLGDTNIGFHAHAEGEKTIAQDRSAHAEGRETMAIGQFSHAEGRQTVAGYAAHAEGRQTEALGTMSHAEGFKTKASGNNSHAEGRYTTASGEFSHAEGQDTTASGYNSHAEGRETKAHGEYTHTEGAYTSASGIGAHAEGTYSVAIGNAAHAEGNGTDATGSCAHAEGAETFASGGSSHAEGYQTQATANNAHAEGRQTIACGPASHAEGVGTIASHEAQHVAGKYNVEDIGGAYAHILGWGASSDDRQNIHTIDYHGRAWFAGNIKVGGTGQNDSVAQTVATQKYVDDKLANISGGSAGSAGSIFTEDTTHSGCYYRMVGSEKEWLNPPMVRGVEYRTMERHNGKTVYTMTDDTGYVESYAEIYIEPWFGDMVKLTFAGNDDTTWYPPSSIHGDNDTGNWSILVVPEEGVIVMESGDANAVQDNWRYQLWYTRD